MNSRYYIGHNTNKSMIALGFDNNVQTNITFPIRILTIGQLRDFEANCEIIDAFAGDSRFALFFSGIGPASVLLNEYVEHNTINNVTFTGRYRKNEENDIVKTCNMMNGFLPHDINSDSLMTNRIYLSSIFRKPMIVNDGCYQADVVKKYGIGVVIRKNDDIKEAVLDYYTNLDMRQYDMGCRIFLKSVLDDMSIFENKIISFING